MISQPNLLAIAYMQIISKNDISFPIEVNSTFKKRQFIIFPWQLSGTYFRRTESAG
jgi:hypothetical protein